MIVALCSDPILRAAIRRCAHPEEDAFLEERLAVQALEQGCPRVIVYVPEDGHPLVRRFVRPDAEIRTVAVTHATLRGWEADRRAAEIPEPRVAYMAARLGVLLGRGPEPASWVDRALAELSRSAGVRLPAPLRSVGRRVMEFPAHYADLHPLSDMAGLTRGALKARFRRRGLPSPSVYVRWFRVLAAARTLAEDGVTTGDAAHRLGFTTGGNFCRTIKAVSGCTPSEVRTTLGWNRLVVSFAWRFLTPPALSAWESLHDLFVREAA